MLHCASCGGHLIGDTGYYRHRNPCSAFLAAKPERDGSGRRDGKGYRREWYEGVVSELLERVQLGAGTIAAVVGEVGQVGSDIDRNALGRIEREREAAIARYRRDRDATALEAAMRRLDAEEARPRTPRQEPAVPAAVARRYLEGLAETWTVASDSASPGRRMLAEALFERIDVLGFREATFRLTAEAVSHGFAAAVPERFVISGYGRGERI